MEDGKMVDSPFQLFHISIVYEKARFDKRGMSIIVGVTNITFCEIGEFGKDSSKVWQLAVSDFHENGILEKLGKNLLKVWQNLK